MMEDAYKLPVIGPRDTTAVIARDILKKVNEGHTVRLSPEGTGRHELYVIWKRNDHLEYITGGRWGITPLGPTNEPTVENIVQEWVRDPR